jgi:glucose-1-phosphate cytidylyltransferase
MKVVLFCGGFGLRMREFSDQIPKPMVPIGTRPVLWHLMRYYAHYGHTEFILCLGHQAEVIKEYFVNYREWISNDFVISNRGEVELLHTDIDDWKITFVDTGLKANIGERLMAVRDHLADDAVFLANYADGLTDCPLPDIIDHARRADKVATFLAVKPRQTFHIVQMNEDSTVTGIQDSSTADLWINGGFFVLKHEIFDHIEEGEELVHEPFERLMKLDQLTAHRHEGFWAGMDTFKDRQQLDELYAQGRGQWAVWEGPPRDSSNQ